MTIVVGLLLAAALFVEMASVTGVIVEAWRGRPVSGIPIVSLVLVFMATVLVQDFELKFGVSPMYLLGFWLIAHMLCSVALPAILNLVNRESSKHKRGREA